MNDPEFPNNVCGLGDLLPADVQKKLSELLERLQQSEQLNHGSNIINIYASGSQHVDRVEKQYISFSPDSAPVKVCRTGNGEEAEGSLLPEVLRTEAAMALWKKVREASYVDEDYQPLLSRSQSALLADAMARRLGIKEKWKVFESCWHRKNMYKDYYRALEQRQSLVFQDTLRHLF